ncbi:MAG: ribonuclease III family protein [Thermosulfidibacteraceae bacterium]|jgi:ribonuclease-3
MQHSSLEKLLNDKIGKLAKLEKRIGYCFKDKKNLLIALIRRSYQNEGFLGFDNERLEFLGDAFLNFVVANFIYNFTEFDEAGLTNLRSLLVRKSTLASAAKSINLGEFLFMGKGEEKQGLRDNDTVLADAFEALVAAILLDGSITKATEFVIRVLIEPYIMRSSLSIVGFGVAQDSSSK